MKKKSFTSLALIGLWSWGLGAFASDLSEEALKEFKSSEGARQKLVHYGALDDRNMQEILPDLFGPFAGKIGSLHMDVVFSQILHGACTNKEPQALLPFNGSLYLDQLNLTVQDAYHQYAHLIKAFTNIMVSFQDYLKDHEEYGPYFTTPKSLEGSVSPSSLKPDESYRLLQKAQFKFCLEQRDFSVFNRAYDAFEQAEDLRKKVIDYLGKNHQPPKQTSSKDDLEVLLSRVTRKVQEKEGIEYGENRRAARRALEPDSDGNLTFSNPRDVEAFLANGAMPTGKEEEWVTRKINQRKENPLYRRNMTFTYSPDSTILEKLIQDHKKEIKTLNFPQDFKVTQETASVLKSLFENNPKRVLINLSKAKMTPEIYKTYLHTLDPKHSVLLSKELMETFLSPLSSETLRKEISWYRFLRPFERDAEGNILRDSSGHCMIKQNAYDPDLADIDNTRRLYIIGVGLNLFNTREKWEEYCQKSFKNFSHQEEVQELYLERLFFKVEDSSTFPPLEIFPKLQRLIVQAQHYPENFLEDLKNSFPEFSKNIFRLRIQNDNYKLTPPIVDSIFIFEKETA